MSLARIFPKLAISTAAILAIALSLAGQTPADAAKRQPSAVRIVSPGDGALVKSNRVRVAVKASKAVDSLRVRVGLRNVSGAFDRRGGMRLATLPVEPVLEPGVNYLYVRARLRSGREAFAYRKLIVVDHRPGLLTSRAQDGGSRGAAVVLTARSQPRGSVLKARLNGKPVAHIFTRRGGALEAALGANDGLRFGRNQVRLLAYDERGGYDVETETFVVPRDAPLAGAGRDRAAWRGDPIRLSAKSSRAARPGSRLSYRWQVVEAPRGTKPKLRRAGSATPALRPNGFGTYRVRLTVREGGRASATDLVTLTVKPDDPPLGVTLHTLVDDGQIYVAGAALPKTGGEGVSYAILDRETRAVLAEGAAPASLAGIQQIETMVNGRNDPRYMFVVSSEGHLPLGSPRNALRVLLTRLGGGELSEHERVKLAFDEQLYFSIIGFPGSPSGSAFTNFSREQTPGRREGQIVGYLQLRPYAAGGRYGFDFYGGGQTFDTRVSSSSSTNSMLVAGQTYEAKLPAGTSGFHLLGIDPGPLSEMGSTHNFNRAYATNTGDPAADQRATVELTQKIENILVGNNLLFLQSIGHPKPNNPAWNKLLEAVEAAGGTRAVIGGLDGSGGYSLAGAGGQTEVQKIVIEESTWDTFAVLFRGAGTDKIPTRGSADRIQAALEGLPTIGHDNVEVSGSASSGWLVEFVGALRNRDLPPLNLVSPGHVPPGLAVIRQGGLPNSYPLAETSEQLSGKPARLTGLLSRARNSEAQPLAAGDAAIPGGGLVSLVYSAGEPFPPFNSAGERKANTYIAGKLDEGSDDVRSAYYKDFNANWALRYSLIQGLCGGSGTFSCPGLGFSEGEFDTVRSQLLTEIQMLTDVQTLIKQLQAPFDKSKADAFVDLVNIYQKISESIGPPDVSTTVISTGLLGQLFTAAASKLEGPAATGAGILAEGLGKAGEQLLPNGSPVLGELKLRTPALGAEMVARYNEASNSLNQFGLILASNYGKLKAVHERVGQKGAWHEVIASSDGTRAALRNGTRRWFWTELLPIAYGLWQLDPVLGTEPPRHPPNAREFNCRNGGRFGMEPFSGVSDLAQTAGPISFEGSGSGFLPVLQVTALGEKSPNWDARSPDVHPPSEALLKPLFEPLPPLGTESEGGLGLYRPQFYSSRNFTIGPSKFSFLHVGKECGT